MIALETLLRETSTRPRDHFCHGRLFQPAEVVWAADEEAEGRILDALASAHARTYAWVRPWLPARFDVETYGRTLLRVSLAHEIRPEPGGRAEALWEAQRADLAAVYALLLEDLVEAGELAACPGGGFAVRRSVDLGERLRLEAYFRWSLVRATVRWAKYVVTFEGWLDYILGKAERHTGERVVLTPRERRLPLLFLWPRVIRYLRQKDR